MRARSRFYAAIAALLLAAGCGGLEDTPRFELSSIVLSAETGANGNQPIAVDLVIIHDGGMIGALSTLAATDWFARKDQFRRDFEDGFKVFGWEMVPENSLPPIAFSEDELEGVNGGQAQAGFLFARYATPGEHRARLESRSGLRVVLGRDSFTLENFDPSN